MTYRFSRPSTKLRSSSSFLFLCGTFMCVVANVVAVVVARGFQWHNFFGSAGVPSYFRGVVATDFRVIWRTPKMHRGEKTVLLFLSDAQQRMQSPRQARSEIPATSPASSQHAPLIRLLFPSGKQQATASWRLSQPWMKCWPFVGNKFVFTV